MAWGIQEVQFVNLTVLRLVIHGHGMRFDRNPAFALQVHGIQQLILLLPFADGLGELQ